MTEEEKKEKSEFYRKHQKKLAKGLMIFILIISAILIGAGLFIAIINHDKYIVIAGTVMVALGVIDIPLIIKFNINTQKRINKMSDKECIIRYCKVYGIDYEEKKNQP